MIYVDIVSDTICPWCYIGKRRFERALVLSGRNDVALSWRPFQLNPDMPPEGMTRDDYVRAKFGGGDRPRQIYQAIAESGREAGIEFQFSKIKRTPNTILSHRLVHWAAKQERQEEVVDMLFKAYFEEGLDTGDLPELTLGGMEGQMRLWHDILEGQMARPPAPANNRGKPSARRVPAE